MLRRAIAYAAASLANSATRYRPGL
jgi:hypothetical protein